MRRVRQRACQQKKSGNWDDQKCIQVLKILAILISLLAIGIATVAANPQDGVVTSGEGSIAANGNTLTIQQSSDKMSIDWQSFSVGSGETIRFVQPGADAVVLNRVMGGEPSGIYGSISANGRVFLVNPNGILFAPGAKVDVGALVASSLDIAVEDFTAGRYVFKGAGGTVINQGAITAEKGAVAFLGGQVENQGVIIAQQGTVALAAGSTVTLDMNGDGLLSVAVDQETMAAQAANHGLIQADGGMVFMTAGAKDALLKTVINNSGVIRARRVNSQGGIITLEGAAVTNSGLLDAAGMDPAQTGGTVEILGREIELTGSSSIDVSGQTGGGTVLVGGGWQGKGTNMNSVRTTVDADSRIAADALTVGDGGQIVIWADGATLFRGHILARGGSERGDGGQVEVSGKSQLLYQGLSDLTAPNGKSGRLLLDPGEYTISTAATGGNVINNTELSAQLKFADVILQTSSPGTGNISVDAPVGWTGSQSLTLAADQDILVHAAIENTSGTGGVNLEANGSLVVNARVATDAGSISLTGENGGTVISGAQLQSKSGNIIVAGTNAVNGYGLLLDNGSRIKSESGRIKLTGTSGMGTVSNMGVVFFDLAGAESVSGAIDITGISRGTGTSGHGILLRNLVNILSDSGKITLTGSGGLGTNDNYGIQLDMQSSVRSGGDVRLVGSSSGTGGNNNIGVVIGTQSGVATQGSGALTIRGQGSKMGNQSNYGVWLLNGQSPTVSTVSGDLTIEGTPGGDGSGWNYGVFIEGVNTKVSSGGDAALVSVGGNFRNETGSNVLGVAAGKRWLVYAKDRAGSKMNGLVNDFIQYNTGYGAPIEGQGNGFVYQEGFSVNASIKGTVDKIYDGTAKAHLLPANFQLDSPGTLVATFTEGTGTYSDRNVGSGKAVAGPIAFASLRDSADGNKSIYGYTVNSSSSAVGSIAKRDLIIRAAANSKIYDGTISSANVPSVSGLQTGDQVTGLYQTYADASIGFGKPLLVRNYVLRDGNGGNNYNVFVMDRSDGTISSANVPSVSGLQTGDQVTGLYQTYADASIGFGKPLLVRNYVLRDGNGGNNYNVFVMDRSDGVILPLLPLPTSPAELQEDTSERYRAVVSAVQESEKAKPGGARQLRMPAGIDVMVELPSRMSRIAEGQIDVKVPRENLFLSAGDVRLEAEQADGQKLPSWLNFDATNIRFYGKPPADFAGELKIRLVATDREGNNTVAVFQLFFER